jgi:hypothetical protein
MLVHHRATAWCHTTLFSYSLVVEENTCDVNWEVVTYHTSNKVSEQLHHGQEESNLHC